MTEMFAPLPLPGTGESLADDVAAWVGSAPLTALLDDFGLERPGGGRLVDRVEVLARASLRWDYRRGKERWEAEDEEFTAEDAIDTIGFDRARSPYEPPHRATELLQEIRSTILWLREIARLLDQPSAR